MITIVQNFPTKETVLNNYLIYLGLSSVIICGEILWLFANKFSMEKTIMKTKLFYRSLLACQICIGKAFVTSK